MSNIGSDTYTLKLLDQITQPLKSIERSMSQVVETATKLEKLASGSLGLLKLAAGVGAAVTGFNVLRSVVSGVVGLLEKGVDVVKTFGRLVIDATLFRNKAITSFNLYEPGKGENRFLNALRIGGITPASELQVVKQLDALTAAGFRGHRRSASNAALLDVQATRGEEERQSVLYYYQKLLGGIGVKAVDIREAAQQAGLRERDVLLKALELVGVKATTGGDNALVKQVMDLKKSNKINGVVIVDALNEMIRLSKSGPTGKLGDAAKKFGMGTLAGLLSNLEDGPRRFLSQMRLERLPGIKSLMEFLKRLLVFFDHATPQGRALTAVVTNFVNVLFGGLDKIDQRSLTKFFEGALRVTEQLVRAIGQVWDLIGRFAQGEALSGSAIKLIAEIGKIFGAALYEGLRAAWSGKSGKPEERPAMFTQGPGKGLSQGLLTAAVGRNRQAGPFRTPEELNRLATLPRPPSLGDRGPIGFDQIFPAPLPTLPQAPRSTGRFLQPQDLAGGSGPPLALPPLQYFGPPAPTPPAPAGSGPTFGSFFSRERREGEAAGRALSQNLGSSGPNGEPHGERIVNGVVRGLERRVAELETGSDPLMDSLAQHLRASAGRVGAPIIGGGGG